MVSVFGEDLSDVGDGAGCFSDDVEHGIAQGGHGLRPSAGTDATMVLAEDDVAAPVEAVLDQPVIAPDGEEGVRFGLEQDGVDLHRRRSRDVEIAPVRAARTSSAQAHAAATRAMSFSTAAGVMLGASLTATNTFIEQTFGSLGLTAQAFIVEQNNFSEEQFIDIF